MNTAYDDDDKNYFLISNSDTTVNFGIPAGDLTRLPTYGNTLKLGQRSSFLELILLPFPVHLCFIAGSTFMDKALIFIAGLILTGCVGGGVNIMGSAPTMEDFKHDLPIVRALLDSNGLSDVSEQKVALRKVDGHGYWYVLDLNNQSIEEFHFTRETKNIKALKTLNMSNNNLNGIPKGIELGKWTQIQLQYNELCSLTPTDSAFLRQIRAEFGNQNCGTI